MHYQTSCPEAQTHDGDDDDDDDDDDDTLTVE
jgi:hypothetical protein